MTRLIAPLFQERGSPALVSRAGRGESAGALQARGQGKAVFQTSEISRDARHLPAEQIVKGDYGFVLIT